MRARERFFGFAWPTLLLLFVVPSARGITIRFDYTYDTSGFFNMPARRSVLEAAADVFESRLTDDLQALTPGGNNTWTAQFAHPSRDGETVEVENLRVPADTVIIYVGGKDLPDGARASLGFGGPGGFSARGTQAWVERVRGRGEANVDGDQARDFATWGGAITFDTDNGGEPRNWNFDIADPPESGQNDFLSVAIHEIGHLLGLGAAESWSSQISGLRFNGPKSAAEFGRGVGMDADLSHWVEGTSSISLAEGTPQESVMDPTLPPGRRKLLTRLDLAALEDIGWSVRPEPLIHPGDFNGDLAVDFLDLALLKANWQTGIAWSQGDSDGDGDVDLADFAQTRQAFGRPVASASVPAPSALLLALVAGFMAFRLASAGPPLPVRGKRDFLRA